MPRHCRRPCSGKRTARNNICQYKKQANAAIVPAYGLSFNGDSVFTISRWPMGYSKP